jgi:hypothetical protein
LLCQAEWREAELQQRWQQQQEQHSREQQRQQRQSQQRRRGLLAYPAAELGEESGWPQWGRTMVITALVWHLVDSAL